MFEDWQDWPPCAAVIIALAYATCLQQSARRGPYAMLAVMFSLCFHIAP